MITGRRKAISNWFRSFKTFVDPDTRRYKLEETFLGIIRTGRFQPLPKIDYVLVFRQFFAKCEACTFEEDDQNSSLYYQVSLVYNRNRRIIVHETTGRTEAFSFAEAMAAGLKLKLRDSATVRGRSSWLRQKN